jgi:competence protein ComEA
MIIYVASIGENITVIPSATADKTTNEQGKSVTAASDKVNINTADMTQLQSLTGIGAKKAQDIIDYREQNGPFKTPEDLANVSGFGEKTIEKLRENITVD